MSSAPYTDEAHVAWRLKQIGLETTKVAENSSEKTCDFRAWDERDLFWIEVKARTGDKTIIKVLRGDEGVALATRPVGYANRTASILSTGVKQLDALARKEKRGFEIVWLVVRSPLESNIHADQAIATAFGTRDILDAGDDRVRPCYFFGESTFFKHKQLDAIVVEKPEGFVMCLNPYAHQLESFKQTKFFEYFNARAVLDPLEEEKAGRAYVAMDCGLPRSEEKDLLEFLRKKYSLKAPRTVLFQDHTGYAISRG